MLFEHIAEGRIRNGIANVGNSTLNPVKSPSGVFLGKAKNQLNDHLADAWPSGVPSLVAMVPLLCDQHAMPSQDCIGCDERADFLEAFATEDLALDRQSAAVRQ